MRGIDALHASGNKSNLWISLRIEPVGAAQYLIALGMRRIDRGGVHAQADAGRGDIAVVKIDCAADAAKQAWRMRQAHMPDSKTDMGVRWLDFPRRHAGTWQDGHGEQGDGAEEFG